MADLITIKSGAIGNRASMPKLSVDELGYRTDTKELYIGTSNGNVRLCGVDDATKINELEEQIADITARLEELEK